MKVKRDQISGLALVILGIVLFILISQFSKPLTAEYPGPRLMPGIAAFGLVVCGLGIFVKGCTQKTEDKVVITKAGLLRILISFAALWLYILGMRFLGFLITTPFLVYGLTTYFAKATKAETKLWVRIVFALVVTGVIWAMYVPLFGMAMTMVLAISKGNMFKGLASTCIGILLATVGFSPIDAEPRFTFGNMYLFGGLGMIVVLTGIFAVSHILVTFGKGFDQPPEVSKEGLKGFGLTLKDIKDELVNIIRSFLMGLGIGFLPGMGSGLSNLVAYSSAKNSSKHPEEYGHGAAGGIWAPEVANNAAIGGAMIPMAALGIPGDSTTALLIGALTIHGLEMGPMVFKNSGDVVYLMFVTVAVVAALVLLMQAVCKRWFPYILKVPAWYMYSALLVICLASAYVDSGNLYKCGMMMVFAAVGILMTLAELPASPLILAFILTPTLETKTLQAFQSVPKWTEFFTRPVSGVLMVIAILCIFSPIFKGIFAKLKTKKAAK